ncbi:MAG: hypothetical protein R3285_09815 [Kiloniellales bacterium]|nr:hypothetical protein [Kiloniellales bacterium]
MRRTLFALLAALFVLGQPTSGALALEANQLREDIIAGLAPFTGPMAAAPLSYEEVRVWPQDGRHRVEITGVTSRGAELGYWADLGDLAFTVEETKAGHYRVTDLAVPASVPVYDADGNRFALLAYDLERFDGIWVSALANFLELDLLVTDVRFGLADGSFRLAMDRLGGVSRAEQTSDGHTDQRAKGRATSLRAEIPGQGAFEIDEIEVDTEVTGMDLEAYAQLTREYEALAAREGGASQADLSAFIQRMSGLDILPASFAERFAVSGLRVVDASGRTQVQLSGGELDLAASGLDQTLAEVRFGLKHENLEMGESLRAQAGSMGALMPRNMGLVAALERLPADRIWQAVLRTMSFMVMQGGQEGQDPAAMNQIMMFMLMGEILPALTEAGAQLKLPHVLIESEAAKLTAKGAFDVNPTVPQGVTGTMDVAVTGLDDVIALLEAEVNAGNQEAFGALGMANWMKTLGRREINGESRPVDHYNLQLTADGQTLLNGQPFGMPQ